MFQMGELCSMWIPSRSSCLINVAQTKLSHLSWHFWDDERPQVPLLGLRERLVPTNLPNALGSKIGPSKMIKRRILEERWASLYLPEHPGGRLKPGMEILSWRWLSELSRGLDPQILAEILHVHRETVYTSYRVSDRCLDPKTSRNHERHLWEL